jgi:uroporphyrinogen decarboxylase
MTAREIVKKRIAHEGTSETPYTIAFEPALLKKLNEHYGCDDWQDKLLKQYTASYLSVDTVRLEKIDDVYSRDALGAIWRMDKRPWHIENNPLAEPTLQGFEFPTSEFFTEPINQDKQRAIENYNADHEHYRIINMGWGIFEALWRLRGFENALTDLLLEEDFCYEATARITQLYIDMLRVCADVPADAYLFGDDWGDQRGVIMGAKTWRKYFKPCWAKIYEEVHRQGKVSVQHSCGSICDIYDDLIEIGMDAHESVQPEARGMAPELIKDKYGDRLSFWGCLGSQGILTHGTPLEIRAEIFRLAALFKEDGGYVLAPAKPLFDEMPVEKAIAVIDALKDINA